MQGNSSAHFMNEETEIQRSYATSPRPCNQWMATSKTLTPSKTPACHYETFI